jgi:hypothetical protein
MTKCTGDRYSVFPAAVGEAGEGREAGHDVVETLRAEEAGEAHLGVAKAQIQQGEGNDPMEREDEDNQQCGFRGTSLVQPVPKPP